MLHLEASVGKWEKYSTAQSDFYNCGYKTACVLTDSWLLQSDFESTGVVAATPFS